VSGEGGKGFVADYRVKHRDGTVRHVIEHAIPMSVAQGKDRVLDGIILDITWRVRMQEQLIQAEGLKTIHEVSARLAHEIRNPLTCAGGFARRLVSALTPNDPNRAKAEIIVKEVGRLEVILKMILNTIQPLELHIERVNPQAFIGEVLVDLDRELDRRGVAIDLQIPADMPDLVIDRGLLGQALRALIRWASEDMSETATLHVRMSWAEQQLTLAIGYPSRGDSAEDFENCLFPLALSDGPQEGPDAPMAKVIINKHGGHLSARLDPSGEMQLEITLPLYAQPTHPFGLANRSKGKEFET
jgi:nitrogen fixation/metabolism regulation signal transduction histidine kinase